MKLYNTQADITSQLTNIFLEASPILSLPQARNLAIIIEAMIEASSIITSKIAYKLKGDFKENKPDSNQKRIYRFWQNPHVDLEKFFDDLMSFVFNKFDVKHKDSKVFVAFDHSYNRDDFTSLVVTLCIGKQAIPIYFRCFEGKKDNDAFSFKTIKDALTRAHSYFPDSEIIFLADRWFNDPSIFNLIDSMADKYVIRTKTNIKISFDGKTFTPLSDIKANKFVAKHFNNVYFSETQKVKTNIVISSSLNTDDPWYLVTNDNPKSAIKHYSKRFGGIEFVFKDQKSNGFNLEKTTTRNVEVFKKMFGATCIAIVWLTILGADYVKNKSHFKKVVNFYDVKNVNGKPIRDKSLFRLGMEIFFFALDNPLPFKLKYNFKLYDL